MDLLLNDEKEKAFSFLKEGVPVKWEMTFEMSQEYWEWSLSWAERLMNELSEEEKVLLKRNIEWLEIVTGRSDKKLGVDFISFEELEAWKNNQTSFPDGWLIPMEGQVIVAVYSE